MKHSVVVQAADRRLVAAASVKFSWHTPAQRLTLSPTQISTRPPADLCESETSRTDFPEQFAEKIIDI